MYIYILKKTLFCIFAYRCYISVARNISVISRNIPNIARIIDLLHVVMENRNWPEATTLPTETTVSTK